MADKMMCMQVESLTGRPAILDILEPKVRMKGVSGPVLFMIANSDGNNMRRGAINRPETVRRKGRKAS